MGKRTFKRKIKNKTVGPKKGQDENGFYLEIVKDNEKYWKYYKEQGLVPEDEWEQFQTALKADLPVSFRVQGRIKDRELLVKELEERFFQPLRENKDEGICVPKPLPWYPGAYQTSMSRNAIRSQPILSSFHNFLCTETELGNVTRQEAVSMIPPLMLQPEAADIVLDMCAAPGSKTSQLIEMMHEKDRNPAGMLIANDLDMKRCYMLVHQTLKRFRIANCVITCNDASKLPNMRGKDKEPLKFDKVLCDVICSGDGTVRKNPDIWARWTPHEGLSLHRMQLPIAKRGAELLKIGGRMVYSTCSMNPIEDEAVVAQLIREAKGTLKLVDAHPILPLLKAKRGVNTWKVYDKDMNVYEKPEDIPEKLQKTMCKSCFPPTKEEAEGMNLHYTMRILPHLQDTGGFFIAVLEKTSETSFDLNPMKGPVAKRQRLFKDDPFSFMEKDDERWKEIKENYGISDDFPYENLFNRRGNDNNESKQLFYANEAVKHFVENNMFSVSIQNAGMKMFGKNDNKADAPKYRIAQEGVQYIFPFMSKQKTKIPREDMLALMEYGKNLVPMDLMKAKDEIRQNNSGSVILYVDDDDPVCAWIGFHSVAPYVTKEERVHILRMMGVDCTEIEELMKSKRKQKARENREEAKLSQQKEKEEQNGQGDTAEKDGQDTALENPKSEEKEDVEMQEENGKGEAQPQVA